MSHNVFQIRINGSGYSQTASYFTLESFQARISQELIQGSAIAPTLFETTVRVVSDLQTLAGGEVAYPLHEALNWHVTRFGQQARATQYAALLVNEDGSCWQAKLATPRPKKDKPSEIQKYETPVGNGSRAYLPALDSLTRLKVAQRYGVHVPLDESFWNWLEQHPDIPIVLTEGGKKALAGFSQGFVAIALYGVNGGYRTKDELGHPIAPVLIPDLVRFALSGRTCILAFDQDIKVTTRTQVNRAMARLGQLLQQGGCQVKVAAWNGEAGRCKGMDDLIVHAGALAFEQAYTDALTLDEWQLWQRLEHQLTYTPTVQLSAADLAQSALDPFPQQGILAIAAAKGTGKTKTIGRLIQNSKQVLLVGHRIALMRNLCDRLGVNYRSDLDKVNGEFLAGDGYTQRIGLVVDSLLAIDPVKFTGCDLVIDEVVQMLRHLLTSSTCRKEGKLPALLSRLRELIMIARRVIVADADLDNASLDYLRELRGQKAPVYLLQNDYQPPGYSVTMIDCPDASVITARLLKALEDHQPGETLLVQTDSKAGSKTLSRLIEQLSGSSDRLLVINAETSGGEAEREFIAQPDVVLQRGDYDVIIASPSLATGVSIECTGVITQVFGIFYGSSSTDADMAQALSRLREPVPRTLWCARYGRNFSKVSRSTNPLQLKSELKDRTDTTAALLRSQLREDMDWELSRYDWQSDPHLNLWCRIEAGRNYSHLNLRMALLVRLKYEGHQVTIEQQESQQKTKLLLKQTRDSVRQAEAQAIMAANVLSAKEVTELEGKEGLSPGEQLALLRHYLSDFYVTDDITPELIHWDNGGRKRSEILSLEAQLYPQTASDRDIRGLEKQCQWQKGITPWAIGTAELKRKTREFLGLSDFFDPDKEWTRDDLHPYAEEARQYARQVKLALQFTITAGMSDVQIVHQLLSQLGIKVTFRWQTIAGKKQRVYRLDEEVWNQLQHILLRRCQRRDSAGSKNTSPGSPPDEVLKSDGGDPIPQKQKNQISENLPLINRLSGEGDGDLSDCSKEFVAPEDDDFMADPDGSCDQLFEPKPNLSIGEYDDKHLDFG